MDRTRLAAMPRVLHAAWCLTAGIGIGAVCAGFLLLRGQATGWTMP